MASKSTQPGGKEKYTNLIRREHDLISFGNREKYATYAQERISNITYLTNENILQHERLDSGGQGKLKAQPNSMPEASDSWEDLAQHVEYPHSRIESKATVLAPRIPL